MKLKLTYIQFMALWSSIQELVFHYRPSTIEGKVLCCIVMNMYKKIHRLSVEKKNRYLIKLAPEEAMTFYLLFKDHNLSVTSFEGNFLNQCIAKIHQQYA